MHAQGGPDPEIRAQYLPPVLQGEIAGYRVCQGRLWGQKKNFSGGFSCWGGGGVGSECAFFFSGFGEMDDGIFLGGVWDA